jgi:hypothetical protein
MSLAHQFRHASFRYTYQHNIFSEIMIFYKQLVNINERFCDMTTTWTIKLFAGLSERFGTPALILALNNNEMKAFELKTAISKQFPEHEAFIRPSFIAQNHAYAADDALVRAAAACLRRRRAHSGCWTRQ